MSELFICLIYLVPCVPVLVHNGLALRSTSTRTGSDFHVPGQNFSAQPGGQVGGGGGSIGVAGGRGPPLGGLQLLDQTTSGISSSSQVQIASGTNIQPQTVQGPTVTATSVHNLSVQEMGKPTHLQNQPPTLQQVYVQNPSRSSTQNYYSSGPRPQQPRNLNHRGAQPGNQSQVVGIAGVAGAGGQPTAIYPHPSLTIQPSAMYVQSQVSGLHTNPHQQNIYSINNQMPMQYSGPPQRHQTHQNQFSYQPYQTHALLTTSNLFGYAHGAQHPGYFFHQPPNAPLNLNRTSANTVSTSNQHLSGSLASNQSATIVPQGTLQPQSQQTQTMHSMSISLPQTDVYSGFNNSLNNVSIRSKKPRTKAITDIVNPNTGKNISAEIYKDDTTTQSGESSNRESPQSLNCNADLLVADFAARVAKLASETVSSTSITDVENSSMCIQVKNQNPTSVRIRLDSDKSNQYNNNSSNSRKSVPESTLKIEKLDSLETVLQSKQKMDSIIIDNVKSVLPLSSTILSTILKEESGSINLKKDNQVISEQEDKKLFDSHKQQILTEVITTDINETELQTDSNYLDKEFIGEKSVEKEILSENVPTLVLEYIDDEYIKSNGESSIKQLEIDSQKCDDQQESLDGKIMQKQKNKNKVKTRELNRRGAEKEGTDMDAFVHPVEVNASSIKIEMKHNTTLQKNIDKEENTEITKEIKEKDNYEFRKDKDGSEIDSQSIQKGVSSFNIDHEKAAATEISIKNKNNKETILGEFANVQITKDVVDHISVFRTKIEKELVPAIVVQKNEENSKVSGLCSESMDPNISSSALKLVSSSFISKTVPLLKYTYSDDQWSPINTSGKKVYGREFLMKLQNDPNSKAKPLNLPDLDVVLKDSTKIRSPVDLWLKDSNLGRHDSLYPGFSKPSVSAKVPSSNKKSHLSKPKTNKPNMIHLTFSREDVKLRETENAWKPRRLVQGSISEEQTKTEALYKRVRSVLNKLTPQKFSTLVNQVRELQIDTQEKLQGVIDLVFEKAVDEPNFSVAYALMCKELSNMQVAGADSEDCTAANFRKLILTRCQSEFEKNTVDENARSEKLKEIEECTDPERKKELQMNFDEEERRIRVKSLGNIRFIGELFKQNMLTSKIMYQCIRHLLNQVDEENLECLCKLLTTIGKVLESKTTELSDYFKQMQQIANRKGKISSRIRFMLQDVIDLRGNKWIPRRDDSNPKTMDQIQREAESERLDIQLSNSSLITPRKDERANDRKRNRAGAGSMEEGGWSQPVGRTRQVYSVETAKLKNKPPSMDDMQLGSRSVYQWLKPKMTTNKFAYLENVTAESDKRVPSIHLSGSKSTGSRDYVRLDYKSNYDGRSTRNGSYQINTSSYNREGPAVENSRSQSLSLISSSKFVPQVASITSTPQLTKEQFMKVLNSFIEEYIAEEEQKVEEGVKIFATIFPITSHISFVNEIINAVFEKSDYHQKKLSQLLAQLLYHNSINLVNFRTGLIAVLEGAADLIIDIPRLWKYFANVLVYPIINDTYCLVDLYTTIQQVLPKLRCKDHAAELFAELLLELIILKGEEWVNQKWSQSQIQWSDLIENRTNFDKFLVDHKLDFLIADQNIITKNIEIHYENIGLNIDKIHDKLLPLLKNSNFDEICSWIQKNIDDKVKEPKFIRILMTAILETSIEQCNDKWTFKVENFEKLQKLIQRYVDAEDDLELQCLFAVQEYITKLSHPAGLMVKIMTCLYENNVLSNEAFLTWEKNEDPAERKGKSVSLVSLKSFFIPLKEVEDISSGEEA